MKLRGFGRKMGVEVLLAVLTLAVAWQAGRVQGRQLLGSTPPLRIGVMHDYVATSADENALKYAHDIINGVYMAIADAGHKTQVVVAGGGCLSGTLNEEEAASSIRTLVQKYNVDAIVGPTCDMVMLANADLIKELKVPMIIPTAGVSSLEPAGSYAYRVGPTMRQRAVAYMQYALKKGYKRVAYITDAASPSGVVMAHTSMDVMTSLGGEVAANVTFWSRTTSHQKASTSADVEVLAKEVMDLKPDAVFITLLGAGNNTQLVASALKVVRRENPEFPIILPAPVSEVLLDAFLVIDGTSKTYPLLDGALTAATLKSPETEQRYARAFGYKDPYINGTNPFPLPEIVDVPGIYHLSYDAAAAIIAAARASGKSSPSAADIQRHLSARGFQFKGWAGRMNNFDADRATINTDVEPIVYDNYLHRLPANGGCWHVYGAAAYLTCVGAS